jgi:hypothetical protein
MMDVFCEITAMFAPILLLTVGVLQSRRFLFGSTFPLLAAGCIATVAVDGSSAAFNVIGGCFFAFGFTCFVLSRRLKSGSFVSRDGLGAIGVLFIVLGFAGFMII